MEYWIVFRTSDGAELYRGGAPEAGTAARQPLDLGQDYLVVPAAAVQAIPADFDAVRVHLCAAIDADAEAARSMFVTPGTGQALTYLLKQQEAAALAADPKATAPIICAEAAAVGITVAEVAGQVRAASAQWISTTAAIEALRRAAKCAVADATTLPAMKAAATIDWSVVAADPSV
jgi:hypothetical protein